MNLNTYIDQKKCKHVADYNDKEAMSESRIKDLIYRNFDKLKNVRIKCEDVDCEECDKEHLWLCLYCGKVYCGEIKQKHSTNHFQRESHYHYLNLNSYTIWCYACYDFVASEKCHYSIRDIFENNRRYEKWKREQMSYMGDSIGPSQNGGYQSYNNMSSTKQATFSFIAEQFLQRSNYNLIKSGELGVSNYASTCYLTSVLQALAHLPYFAKYFISCQPYLFQRIQHQFNIPYGTNVNGEANSDSIKQYLEHLFTIYTASALQALQIPAQTDQLQQNNQQQQNNLQIANLYKALQAQNHFYLDDRQQDAQEFLINLFMIMSQVLNQKFGIQVAEPLVYAQSNNHDDPLQFYPQRIFNQQRDILNDCFRGYMATNSTQECQQCQQLQKLRQSKFSKEVFIVQPLDIVQHNEDQTILNCIEHIVQPQYMEKTCDQCGQQCRYQKQSYFYILPPVLCFNFKCYNQDMSKLNINVKLLNNIDLRQFIHQDSPHQRFSKYANMQIIEQLNLQSQQQMYERLIYQATGMLVGRQIVDCFVRKLNITPNDLATRPEYAQIVEVLCMCSFSFQFFDIFEQVAKECKVRLQKVATNNFKVQLLLRYMYNEMQLLKAGKQIILTQLLRQRLSQKYSKLYKIPYDIDALMAGSTEYELCAYVVHTGDLKSGHYTAYCKTDNGIYKNFDDIKITTSELNKPRETPYLVFYQKKQNQIQEIIQQQIYQEIYSELTKNNVTKMCETMFEFLKIAQDFCKKQLNCPLRTYPEKCQVSGEFLYRLQQMPWPGGHQFNNLSDSFGKYAVQPAMVPPSIYISNRLFTIIEACFGRSDCITDHKMQVKQQLINDYEKEQQLYDKIMTQQQKQEFALSTKFLQKWTYYLFQEVYDPSNRYSICVNADLCNERSPYNRFDLKRGLKKDIDYICINRENFEELQKHYKCFEVEVFDENDLDGFGVEAFGGDIELNKSDYQDDVVVDQNDSLGE